MRDPYDVLGLTRSASEAEVKRAYRKLAKSNHPDSHAGDPKAEARAQAKLSEINGAYEILGDKAKRAQFDRGEIDAEGKPRFQGFEGFRGGQASPGAGFENVDPQAFADILAGFGRGGGGGARGFRFTSGPKPSATGEQDDLLSSILGGLGGRGRSSAPHPPGKDVRGEVAVTLEDIAGGTRPKVSLPTGKTVALTLPKGVADGQLIRLQGQGQASPGGAPGDALVTVRIVPHPLFKPEGSDLRLDLPVSLDEAVLGARIAVPTLSGKVNVTVPAHSSSGRVLRLKGKGLPKATGHGDLLVTPRIVLPDSADPELDSLMRRWRDEKRSSPRGPAYD